jgi:uncharacterized integral membrane protein
MQIVRWVVGVAIFLALLLLSLQNVETVKLRFFNLASIEAPLIFIVLVAFACGVAAGLLAGAIKAARLKRQLTKLRREQRRRGESPAPHGVAPAPGPWLARDLRAVF